MSPLRSRSGGMVTLVDSTRSRKLGVEIVGQRRRSRSRSAGRRPNWSRCSRPGGLRRWPARGRARPGFRAAARRYRRAARCRRRPRPSCRPFRRTRPGRRPATWPNRVDVDDVGGDRLAVDLDQRPARPQARGVDRAGEGFLARAGLADRSGSAGGCARPWRRPPARRGNRARRRPIPRAAGSGASFSASGASSPAARRRSRWALSASSSRSGATGRTRKSLAPARIASTAQAIDPPSASTMIGRSGRAAFSVGDQCRARSRRSSPTARRRGLRAHAGP